MTKPRTLKMFPSPKVITMGAHGSTCQRYCPLTLKRKQPNCNGATLKGDVITARLEDSVIAQGLNGLAVA